MTQAREEQLISDVAETKALLQQFMQEIKPTLATCQQVADVSKRLDDHIENHKETRIAWPAWVAIVASTAIGAVSCYIGIKK